MRKILGINQRKNHSIYEGKMERKTLNIRYTEKTPETKRRRKKKNIAIKY